MNGNTEVASSRLAEFIGKGDLGEGMVDLISDKWKDLNRLLEKDFKPERMNFKNEL